jgi:hypothetical protein
MVGNLQLNLNSHAEHILDWFHVVLQASCPPVMGHCSAMIVDQTVSSKVARMVRYRWHVLGGFPMRYHISLYLCIPRRRATWHGLIQDNVA